MSRLDDLIDLRRQIDAEIERERVNAARATKLRRTALVAISRGSWTTRVFSAVCQHYDVSGDDVLSDARARYVINARHVAIWLMRDAGRTYSEIGREMGRDHTSVIHACRRVEGRPDLLAVAAEIRGLLTGESAA